jgi:hypothetical protein
VLVTLQQTDVTAFMEVCRAIATVLEDTYVRLREEDPRWVSPWGEVELMLNPNGPMVHAGSDGDNGQIGFVYNISKNWRPEWGGMLHFLRQGDPNYVEKVISPRYNALVLFDLSTTAGADHFVSHVTTSQAKRLSFTGWFK